MWRRTEARHRVAGPPASYASALLTLLLSGCGSHVVVAEQLDAGAPLKTHSEDAEVDGEDAHQAVFTCGKKRCTNHPASVLGVTLNGFACCPDPEHSVCGV